MYVIDVTWSQYFLFSVLFFLRIATQQQEAGRLDAKIDSLRRLFAALLTPNRRILRIGEQKRGEAVRRLP
jgi:hypothetical protein